MALNDYPIDVRVDYPPRSSRGWAALTIVWIKFVALIPHFFVLAVLSIAQLIVAFVAQIVVAIKGEYPRACSTSWPACCAGARGSLAFFFSITDRYPPFALGPDPAYPVDVVLERPAPQQPALRGLHRHRPDRARRRLHRVHRLPHPPGLKHDDVRQRATSALRASTSARRPAVSGLVLRDIAALPHYIVLLVLGIAAAVVWIVVQWVILFAAVYPRGMFDFSAGVLRWQTRVSGYTLGLSDRYPPFTFEPSIGPTAPGPAPAAWGSTAVPGAAPASAPPALVCRPLRAPHPSLLGRRAVDPARGRRRASLLRAARRPESAGRP